MERAPLPRALADEVRDRLGIALDASPGASPAATDALYRTWCERFPFDPVAKAAAMIEGRRPPGDDPVEVAERWLATGLGSTCWGSVTLLGALLSEVGVATTIGLDRMLADDLVDFHAFLVARLDGTPIMLDTTHPTGPPLPLVPGARGSNPVYGVGIDEVDGRLEHWFAHPEPRAGASRYAVLSTQLDRGDVRAFCAVSSQFSGVGGRFFVRRCTSDGIQIVRPTPDGTALRRTTYSPSDTTDETFEDLDEGLDAAGLTKAALDLLLRSRLLTLDPGPRWTT